MTREANDSTERTISIMLLKIIKLLKIKNSLHALCSMYMLLSITDERIRDGKEVKDACGGREGSFYWEGESPEDERLLVPMNELSSPNPSNSSSHICRASSMISAKERRVVSCSGRGIIVSRVVVTCREAKLAKISVNAMR